MHQKRDLFIGDKAAMPAPVKAAARKASKSHSVKNQGIASPLCKFHKAVAIPMNAGNRLVPFATTGGMPKASNNGKLIAAALDAAAFKNPQRMPANNKRIQLCISGQQHP